MGTRTYSRRGSDGQRYPTSLGLRRLAPLREERKRLLDEAAALIGGGKLDFPDPDTISRIRDIGKRIMEGDTEEQKFLGNTGKLRSWQRGTPGLDDPDENGRFPPVSTMNSPERQAYREQIINEYLSQGSTEPKSDGKPVAIVMMGGPASGKSTYRVRAYGDEPGYVTIDADDVKGKLPEYELAVANSDIYAAARAHEESSDIAKAVYRRALANRMNLIFDGTGKNANNYERMIRDLKDAGYEVRLMMPHIEAEDGIARVSARAEKSGRYVPDYILQEAYQAIPRNFFRLARQADEAILIDGYNGNQIATLRNGAETLTPAGEQFKARFGG